MRILFTGGSSFTGLHFVTALTAAGHQVVCPLRQTTAAYAGIRRSRVDQLRPIARRVEEVSFGSEAFIKLISEAGPFDLLAHHAADVADYKSPDFDPIRALENNTKNLNAVLSAFKAGRGKAVVLTGTLFEPDEGKGDQSLRAFSPYGLSKGLTWQMFRYYCGIARVPVAKFVSPNPFGPFEEGRFTSYLMTTWKAGKTAQIRTPDYVRDNCHVDLLARAYAALADRAARLDGGCISTSPSGYVEDQRSFTARIARETKSRTDWPCAVEFLKQEDFSEPLVRSNKEPITTAFPDWNERISWDNFVQFYRESR